jgi:hypothetical protein
VALTLYENVMALPHRWFCFWLVSLFSFGNLNAQQSGSKSVTNTDLTMTWTISLLSDGRIRVNVTRSDTFSDYWRTYQWNGGFSLYASGTEDGEYAPIGGSSTGSLAAGFQTNNAQFTSTASANTALWYKLNFSGTHYALTYISGNVWTVPFRFGSQSHTVTITPTAPSIRVGQTVNFTASGGQNGYNWSSTNGGSLAYDGANAAFVSSTVATYVVQVWSPAGGEYPESNYASATITVTASEKVKVNLPANKTGRPIEYIMIAAGQTIGTEVQNIGAPARVVEKILPPNIPSGTPVTLLFRVVGIEQDSSSGTWTIVPGAVTTGTVATLTPSTNPTTVGPDSPDFIGPKLPDSSASPVTGDQSGKSVWSAPPASTALTDSAYKEGVDKTSSALDKINKTLESKLSTGGGGTIEEGETGDTGTHDRLDSIDEKMETEAAKHQEALDNNPTSGQTASSGNSAGNSESGAVKQYSAPNVSLSGASAPVFGITLPAAFGGQTFDLNPFQSSRFASICAWHRKACEWLAVVLFGLWCAKEASAMIRGLTAARQATGNTVFAGTGGQATAFIAAGIITVIMAVAIVAVCTFSTTNLGGGTLLSVIDDDPFSGLIGGAVWMMDQLFPLGAVIACFAGRLVWQAAAQSAFTLAAAAIRFVVP